MDHLSRMSTSQQQPWGTKDGESVARRLSRPAEVKTQSEKGLSYRKMFSGTLQIVEALAQLLLTEMLESTDQ